MLQKDLFQRAEAVVISSTDFTPERLGYVYVGGGGDAKTIKVDTEFDSAITFTGIQTGTILPVLVKKIYKVGFSHLNLLLKVKSM